jgi:hypothetical protein
MGSMNTRKRASTHITIRISLFFLCVGIFDIIIRIRRRRRRRRCFLLIKLRSNFQTANQLEESSRLFMRLTMRGGCGRIPTLRGCLLEGAFVVGRQFGTHGECEL